MSLLSVFTKKSKSELPLEKKIKSLKMKEVNYVYDDLHETEQRIMQDDKALLDLEPVNYYALKSRYLKACYCTNEDYSENYVRLFAVESVRNVDKVVGKTGLYPVSREVLVRAYAKVGIIIN